jgi:hypothetical protein
VKTWDALPRASVAVAWSDFAKNPDTGSTKLLQEIDREDSALADTVAYLIGGDINQARALARLASRASQ